MSGPDDAGLVERLLDNAWGLNVADTLGKRDADRAEAATALQSQAAEIARHMNPENAVSNESLSKISLTGSNPASGGSDG